MANYALEINSKFEPFTYELLIAPLRELTLALQRIEDEYSQLLDLAAVWEKLANSTKDKSAYDRYVEYDKRVSNAADILDSEGLNASSRKEMLKLKRDYYKIIKPIEDTYNKRAALIEELRKGRLSDKSMLYDTEFSDVSIDELMNNPAMSYTPYSGNELYAKGVNAGKAYSSQFVKLNKDLTNNLSLLYLAILYGLGTEYADKWLNNELLNYDLDKAVDDIAYNSNLKGNAVNPGKGLIRRGIAEGLAEQIKLLANGEYLNKALRIAAAKLNTDTLITLAKYGLKEENGKIVKDENSPLTKSRQIKILGSTNTYDPELKMIKNSKGEIIPNEDGSLGTIGVSDKSGPKKNNKKVTKARITSPRIYDKKGGVKITTMNEIERQMKGGKYKPISYSDLLKLTIEEDGLTKEDPRYTSVKLAIGGNLPEWYEYSISDDDVIMIPLEVGEMPEDDDHAYDNSNM